jgi:hypothetical protein
MFLSRSWLFSYHRGVYVSPTCDCAHASMHLYFGTLSLVGLSSVSQARERCVFVVGRSNIGGSAEDAQGGYLILRRKLLSRSPFMRNSEITKERPLLSLTPFS